MSDDVASDCNRTWHTRRGSARRRRTPRARHRHRRRQRRPRARRGGAPLLCPPSRRGQRTRRRCRRRRPLRTDIPGRWLDASFPPLSRPSK
ncbi:hypothetical protein SORBI_3010G227600 [Sorghum bicolor]|uniref:Uncharacterized protein n=1 Tax=Sorghum bicolor TaxID=4558 RepID=A0A194YKW0_SORBI|nr:hypothetical protein SORBI_3010G227600 [Sorghum bicolor]